jgi:FeS assembly SUF system regulator
MIRIAKITDYGISLLTLLARPPVRQYSASELAIDSGIPLDMVSKILKKLTKAEILYSTRGHQGGYALAKPVKDISIAMIIELFEGKISMTDCLRHEKACKVQAHCASQHRWAGISAEIYAVLDKMSLSSMCATESPMVFSRRK